MAMSGGTFEILSGVRRAKAFQLAGAQTIRAIIQNPDGTAESEIDVPIDSLRSPYKSDIDMSTTSQADRFWSIWHAITGGRGSQLPPIVIQRGSRGKPVKDIGWIY
jgi:hypothetical protein